MRFSPALAGLHHAEEARRDRVAGVGEDLMRGPLFDDGTAAEKDDAVRDLVGETQ